MEMEYLELNANLMDIEKRQAEYLEFYVKQASSMNGAALTNVVVDATSHSFLFAFSDILAVSNVLESFGPNTLYIYMHRYSTSATVKPPVMDVNALSTIEEVKSYSKVMFKTIKSDSLPEEMVWEILVRVQAQDIFDATLFVCWNWYKMIHTRDFKYAQFRHSTPGLLTQNMNEGGGSYMTMRPDGKIDISEYSYNFKRKFWSSCNGLVLESTFGEQQKLAITNPVTKQHLALPPFFPGVALGTPDSRSALAYAATPMEYKVIRIDYLDLKNSHLDQYCTILTVGADSSWRIVDTKNLSPLAGYFYSTPFVTEGFVHWAHHCSRISSVLTLNVETEIFTMNPGPRPYVCTGLLHCHFSVGTCVSVLAALSYFKWEVWEMKPETGEWTKMPGIDLEDQKYRIISHEHDGSFKPAGESTLCWQLRPAGWLKYREVMIFIVFKMNNKTAIIQTQLRVAYNVRTQDIHFFKLNLNYYSRYLVHSNTLLWVDGC